MMRKDDLLILDFNNILYRAYYALPLMHFAKKITHPLVGFIYQFCKQINTYKPKSIIVCHDAPPYIRKKMYKNYKGIRTKDKDMINVISQNRDYCQEFLDLLGIPTWKEGGLEADDLIMNLCIFYNKKFKKIIIISSDDDLYQTLIYRNVFLERDRKKPLYSRTNFYEDYEIPACMWTYVKALTGTHNQVEGIKGVGIKTARKIVWSPIILNAMSPDHKRIFNRNIELIRLPYRFIDKKFPDTPKYNERDMINFMSKYGIELQQWMRDAFILADHR